MKHSSRHRAKWIARTLATMIVCVAAGTAIAQDAEQPDRYEVELIVFRHVDQSRNTPETDAPSRLVFSDVPTEPVSAEDPGDKNESESDRLLDMRDAFTPLNRDQLKLSDTYSRLVELDAYAPILHTGWAQEARSTDEALPNRLTSLRGDQAPLSGSVTLYKQRFLHLNIDLALGDSAGTDTADSLVFSDRPQLPEATTPRLQESRRIRNEDLNYFDHPRIGVIVTVREIQSDDTETATDTDTES